MPSDHPEVRLLKEVHAKEPGTALLWWGLAFAVIVWLGSAISVSPWAFFPATATLLLIIIIVSLRVFPARETPARQRLPLLLLLAVPWLVSIVCGPIGRLAPRPGEAQIGRALLLQNSLLAVSIVLPCVLMTAMRDGRRFTAVIGLLNICVTLVVVSASDLIMAPGS